METARRCSLGRLELRASELVANHLLVTFYRPVGWRTAAGRVRLADLRQERPPTAVARIPGRGVPASRCAALITRCIDSPVDRSRCSRRCSCGRSGVSQSRVCQKAAVTTRFLPLDGHCRGKRRSDVAMVLSASKHGDSLSQVAAADDQFVCHDENFML